MPKYLDIDGLRTLWAQITNKIGQQSNATAEALEGKADLVEGKIPASQLPSYVDDVLEYANKASFPATGESGKIYLDLATNLTYRWGGTAYTEISPSLALGTTSSTAYRGDYGAAAYTHAVTNKGIAKTSGLYKITTNAEGHVTAATAVVKADITGLGIPAQDTTYGNATTTTNGLMSSTDKTKLDSINLSALVKSVNGITPDNNGNVAIEVGGGTVSGNYLPLTGGTLSGNLTISNSNNYSYLYLANQNGENIGGLYASDGENRLYLINHAPNSTTGKYEGYGLPPVTTDNLTEHKWYKILTSKETVTVAQGGTGATTAADARTALGITPANIGAAPTSHTHDSVTTSGCTLGIGLYNNHPLLNVLYGTKQAWAIEKEDNTYNLRTHFYKTDGSWQNSGIILNTLNCLEQGVRKIYYDYSQLGLTAAATSYEIWTALPANSSFVARNSNFSQVTDTPNEYGVVQITKTNNDYGAGLFTRVNTAASDFYWASFYANRTFDGWRKVITSEGGTLTGTTSTVLSLNTTNANNFIYIKSNDVNKVSIGYYNGLACIANEATLARIGVNDSGTPQYWSNATASTAKTLLHEGNYKTYVTPTNIGAAPTSHASTATTYGAASASNYGHAMASSTTPKALGTAAVGSETAKFARGDHVHALPALTSCTGTLTVTKGGTGATDPDTALANLGGRKIYYDLEQLGLTAPATIINIFQAMPSHSSLVLQSASYTQIVEADSPVQWGSFIIDKAGTYGHATCVTATSTHALYDAYLYQSTTTATITFSGWKRVITEDNFTDNKVAQTSTNPTTSTKYYLLAGSSSSTTTAGAVFNSALNVNFKNGTASAEGNIEIVLGNSTATGTAGNKTGWLCLYSPGTSYHMIKPASTNSALTHTLPAKSGTILNTGTFVASTTAPSSPVTGMFWVDIS